MQNIYHLGSFLLSLLTGSLAVTLLSLYQGSEVALIIIVCSCYLHTILQLSLLFISWDHYHYLFKVIFTILQLLTVGSAIEFFHYWIDYSISLNNSLHKRIILAFESSLLFLLLANGIFLGIWTNPQNEMIDTNVNEDSHDIEKFGKLTENDDIPYVPSNKFVPLKDSAQTLTPHMFNIQMEANKSNVLFDEKHLAGPKIMSNDGIENVFDSTKIHRDWMKNEMSHRMTTGAGSSASVIRYQLGKSYSHPSKKDNLGQKFGSLSVSSFTSKKSSPSRSPLENLQALKFKSFRKFHLLLTNVNKENESQLRVSEDRKPIKLKAKYLPRFSTTSDLRKSFINIFGSSNSEEAIDNNASAVSNNDAINQIKDQKCNSDYNKTTNYEFNNSSPSAYNHTSFIEVSGHVLNDEQFQNLLPKLAQERQAIRRIDNALLPPCLQKPEKKINADDKLFIPSTQVSGTPSFLIPERSNDDTGKIDDFQGNVLNELHDLTQIPDFGFGTEQDINTPNKDGKVFEYPPKISLDMWERNKADLMRKAGENSQNSTLLSPFQFNLNMNKMKSISESPLLESKQDFIFPDKNLSFNDVEDEKYPINTKDKMLDLDSDRFIQKGTCHRNISDTISALEKYLNENEALGRDHSQLLEESLRQDNESVVHMVASTDFTRSSFRNSPTKSLISIISGGTNHGHNNIGFHKQRSQNLSFSTSTHTKTPSQLLQYNFPSNIYNTSTQSSPTKQRFKRLSKKLSLSTLSDSMFPETGFGSGHSRQQSIEFTYIHNLQNNKHIPSKSISAIQTSDTLSHIHHNSVSGPLNDVMHFNSDNLKKNDGRKHSIVAVGKIFRSANSLFYKHKNVTIEMVPTLDISNGQIFKPPPMENLTEERKASNQTSMGSESVYPDIVMSEYDREKWNTMKNLNIIDDEGHLRE